MQWAEKPVVLSPLVIDLKYSVARIPKFLPVTASTGRNTGYIGVVFEFEIEGGVQVAQVFFYYDDVGVALQGGDACVPWGSCD